MRLNLGCGVHELADYVNLDRKRGQEAFPLDYPDGSVEEIRASHVLEHFSHRDTYAVLKHWFTKLRPGGRLRLAVPDFEWITKHYLAGKPINVLGYVMGGHDDADDWHGAIFDREALTDLLITVGFERIGPWQADLQDCSSLECSLNLQAFKPSGPRRQLSNVAAVLSAPRFGPVMHFRLACRAFALLGLRYQIGSGAYWHQVLSEMLESCLADKRLHEDLSLTTSFDYLLTLDYDTVFSAEDVLELVRLLDADTSLDAVCAVQMKRACDSPLLRMEDANGKARTEVHGAEFNRHLTPIASGHFGLTLFRATSLASLPRPWMLPRPDEHGRWRANHLDADMAFWKHWQANGKTLCLANRVVVGHLQEVVTWPGKDLKPVYQTVADFEDVGIPAEVVR